MKLISRPPRIRHVKAPRHSQQHFAFPRRCEARAKLYVGAHKAVRGETPGEEPTALDSLVARKPPRRSNNRLADIHDRRREVDRDGRPTMVGRDYTPEANRREGISTITVNDLHARPPARVYVQCYRGIIPGLLSGVRRDFDLRCRVGYNRSTRNRGRTPDQRNRSDFSPREVLGRDCFLLYKTRLVLFRHDFLYLWCFEERFLPIVLKEKFSLLYTCLSIFVKRYVIAVHKHKRKYILYIR